MGTGITRRGLFKAITGAGAGVGLAEFGKACQAAGIKEAQVDEIQETDIIILKTEERITCEMAAHLRDSTKVIFPKNKVIILDSGLDLQIIKDRK